MTAYEMRIIDWISYVCSSYLLLGPRAAGLIEMTGQIYVWQSNAPNATEDLARRIREGFGVETRALSAEDIRALDENLAPMFSRGLFFPENGHTLNPLRLVQTLADMLQAEGGQVLRRKAVSFGLNGTAARHLQCLGVNIEADRSE